MRWGEVRENLLSLTSDKRTELSSSTKRGTEYYRKMGISRKLSEKRHWTSGKGDETKAKRKGEPFHHSYSSFLLLGLEPAPLFDTVLSGHSCLGSYLIRMKRPDDLDVDADETKLQNIHIFFQCRLAIPTRAASVELYHSSNCRILTMDGAGLAGLMGRGII